MRRISVLCAAAGLTLAALAATSPASANPFHLIRWADTGACQIWDEGVPTTPWPAGSMRASKTVPTFTDALAIKAGMLSKGHCKF